MSPSTRPLGNGIPALAFVAPFQFIPSLYPLHSRHKARSPCSWHLVAPEPWGHSSCPLLTLRSRHKHRTQLSQTRSHPTHPQLPPLHCTGTQDTRRPAPPEAMRRPLLSSIASIMAGTSSRVHSECAGLHSPYAPRHFVYCSGGRIAVSPRSVRRDSWREQCLIFCYVVRGR